MPPTEAAEVLRDGPAADCPCTECVAKRAGADALDRLAQKDEEIRVLTALVDERNRVLSAVPCPEHGPCVPYALEQVARLAQTCGNCQHLYADPDLVREVGPLPWGWCKAPEKDSPRATQILTRYPFAGNPMPLDERCKGWTKRENA